MNLTKAAKHEAFSSTRWTNGLQFSHKIGVPPLNNLESTKYVKAVYAKRENQRHFELLVSCEVKPQIMASNKYNLYCSAIPIKSRSGVSVYTLRVMVRNNSSNF